MSVDYVRRLCGKENLDAVANLTYRECAFLYVKCKGKSVPLEAWSGSEGSRRLRFPDFVPTAQDGGRLLPLRTDRLYPPANIPGAHFC